LININYNDMILPKELKVRIRKDGSKTPLGFITYVDENGKIRAEKSWSSWGDKEIPVITNEPSKGFKLAGLTQRSADWFGSGRTMFYIIHPKGFEFEITADNLFALMGFHDIIKGEIMGELVLVWDKFSLSLISVESSDYEKYKEQTSTITSGIVAMKDLIPGHVYSDREGTTKFVYIGNYYLLLTGWEYVRGTEVISEDAARRNRWEVTEVTTIHPEKFHMFRNKRKYNDGRWEYMCCKTKKCFDTGKTDKVISIDEMNTYITKQSDKWYSGIRANHYNAACIWESKPTDEIIAKYVTEGSEENTLVRKIVDKPHKVYVEKDCKIIR